MPFLSICTKIILDRPNCFGQVKILFVGSKSFWLGSNRFGQVQIIFFRTNFYNLDLPKIIWTGPNQNELGPSKTIGPK